MLKAVVFDMDGVIIDSEKLYRRYQMEEGKKWGIPEDLMQIVCEKIAGGTKYTNKQKFEDLVGRGIDYFDFREGMINRLDAHIRAHGVDLKYGVAQTLQYLHEKGIKIGLATSTVRERAYKILTDHGIYDYFYTLVFGDEVEHGKPAPDIYLAACERLGVKPEEAVGVEDSINGIVSSSTAGLYTVMVVDLIPPKDEIRPLVKQIYDDVTQLRQII